jgi:hypothetical protein
MICRPIILIVVAAITTSIAFASYPLFATTWINVRDAGLEIVLNGEMKAWNGRSSENKSVKFQFNYHSANRVSFRLSVDSLTISSSATVLASLARDRVRETRVDQTRCGPTFTQWPAKMKDEEKYMAECYWVSVPSSRDPAGRKTADGFWTLSFVNDVLVNITYGHI